MSSNSEFSPELRKELLDDFYAECDELLTGVREGLAQLERLAGEGRPGPTVVETMFRQMHSIKGISAIAGLRPSELLAHGIEDFLRQLTRDAHALTPGELDVLFAATQRLESVVAAHRAGQPLPAIEDLLARLQALLPGGQRPVATPAAAPPPPASRPASDSSGKPDLAAWRASGLHPWRATFAPSKELDQRGVSVKTVRERLGQLGAIVSATPLVGADKKVRFEMVVALKAPPADLAGWTADGVQFEPIPEVAAPVAIREPEPPDVHSLTPSHLVRVDLARLDELMRITGELVIHRFRLDDRLKGVDESTGLKEISVALGRSLRELRGAIAKVRLVPVSELFTRLPFVVRDLVRDSGKKVRVELEGQQTEIDKYLVERLKEPLLHLVRNAFSHGIETAAERVAAGKPAEATITLRAHSVGESALIRIRDDGRGVDAARVVARAKALGMNVPEQPEAAALLAILCAPGFSTRDEADLAAGRGVGMAVVLTTVRELGGTITLETQPGVGTEFTLRVPLTLSIVDAVIVAVGPELCAIPQASIEEIVQVDAASTWLIKQTEVAPYRGGLLPLLRLRHTFRLAAAPTQRLTVMVLSSERGATGLVVDAVKTQREIVVRPLLDPLVRVPGMSGATELGDGRPVLVLDPVAITSGVVRPSTKAAASPESPPALSDAV